MQLGFWPAVKNVEDLFLEPSSDVPLPRSVGADSRLRRAAFQPRLVAWAETTEKARSLDCSPAETGW